MGKRRALRQPRVPFTRAVCVTVEGVADEAHQLEAVNLSRGGLFVKAAAAPLPGTKVHLELAAAGRFLEFAEGEVAWARAEAGWGGFGVRFTHLRPNAQALLEHLMERGGTGGPQETAASPSKGARIVLALALTAAASGALVRTLRHRPVKMSAAAIATTIARITPSALPQAPTQMSLGPEPAAVDPAAHPYPGDFQFALPTGAVSTLRVTINDGEVAVTPTLHKNAAVKSVFTLTNPSRLVIDVAGRAPRYSWQLEGTTVVKSVRVGARNHGTRVVVDLPERPDGQRYRIVTPNS